MILNLNSWSNAKNIFQSHIQIAFYLDDTYKQKGTGSTHYIRYTTKPKISWKARQCFYMMSSNLLKFNYP